MDNLEYLQQISQSNRPVAPSKQSQSPISMALIGKILLGGIVILALLIGISILANNRSNKSEDLTQQLYLRINNINGVVTSSTSQLKSSQLRSINVSLSGALTNTSNQLDLYGASITEEGSKVDPLAPSEAILAAESAHLANLNNTLTNAKLNGIFDRIYAAQIHLQVSLLLSMASELSSRAEDPALLQIIGQFYSSLSVIEASLDNYSNPSA